MIFVVVDKQVDNFSPILKGFARADEEVLFVEDMQHFIF
jgi:hypothetical protein